MPGLKEIVKQFNFKAPERTVDAFDVYAKERQLAFSNNECRYNYLNRDRVVNGEDVKRAISDGFEDGNILKGVLCLNNSVITIPTTMNKNNRHRIKEYITELTQIGSASANGYAMISELQNRNDNVFVVKVPRETDYDSKTNQLHEYVVGVYGTNSLRSEIPNFSYVMGRFNCSSPYIDNLSLLKGPTNKRQALTYCQTSNEALQTEYIIYEPVFPSVSLGDFIVEGCTSQEFLNVFTQLLFALDLAYTRFKFTHNDLHTDNVLVKRLDRPITIKYSCANGETYYLETSIVATIIDYGQSYIEYQGEKLGFQLLHEANILADRPHHSVDIVKILLMSAAAAYRGFGYPGENVDDASLNLTNRPVFELIRELMTKSYFPGIKNDFGQYVTRLADFYFVPPLSYDKKYKSGSYFYQEVIAGTFDAPFMRTEPGTKLYGCFNKDTCKSLDQIYLEYSKPVDEIKSPYEFYEHINLNPDSEKLYRIGKEKASEFIESLITDHKEIRRKIKDSLNVTKRTISLKNSFSSDATRLSVDNLKRYHRYFLNMLELTSIIDDNNYLLLVVEKLVRLYPFLLNTKSNDGITYATVYENMKFVLSPSYLNKYKVLKSDIEYSQSRSYNLRQYPQAAWLVESLPDAAYSVTLRVSMFKNFNT